ncbi:MAG: trehalose-6-phosphate synthase [Gemmatimonadales bacterium]|jgi:trehalose 6-phosphate synthase|nr:trehalose-6-phosphate synthase [Gemmatimonadales bacterium]
MLQALKFVLVLVAALALLAVGAAALAGRTMHTWSERDIRLRAELALGTARQALAIHWRSGERDKIASLLGDIVRDERIMGAAACDAASGSLAVVGDYPAHLSCSEVARHVRPDADSAAAPWQSWGESLSLRGGGAHVSALPIVDGGETLGFVVLLHDMRFVEGRERKMREFLLLGFGLVAVAAATVTLLAVRLSRRGWNRELRRLIRGDVQHPELQPLLQDVRELIERISEEKDSEAGTGTWTPQRLRQALHRYLHGERVVIVANREPYIHERTLDGGVKLVHPASGLVTALEPVMRACSGVWVAHGSGSADRETADRDGRLKVPPGEDAYVLRRVWLTPEEEKGYYYGFSNEGLWPLCHIAHARPIFRSADWQHYQEVNRTFADAVCAEVDSEDPIILVQDYHFALAPAFIRERLPRATILTFWHIPWPNAERLGICPWREEILTGLLGSSIVGFHTQSHCNNFVDSVDRYLEARIDREQFAVVQRRRTTLVRPYPISIDWPNGWALGAPPVAECRASVIADLGLQPDALIGVGVDRLDYTKGIEERLQAVERLLEKFPTLRGRFTFVQLAAPSRAVIERYRQLNEAVEREAARINERFGADGYRPIVLLRAHHEPPTVFRYYRAADVCYVSSLDDGMNLVAKEFVAARDDERGVLVLSRFTGAARELTEALITNPYDLDEASAALATAVTMTPQEQQDRMRAMRSLISHFNVYRWAGRMLIDAAHLRRHDRLVGRLSEVSPLRGGQL